MNIVKYILCLAGVFTLLSLFGCAELTYQYEYRVQTLKAASAGTDAPSLEKTRAK